MSASESKQERDFLTNDIPIPGQNYVCLSFVSPEKVLKNKELFKFFKFARAIQTDENCKETITDMKFDVFQEKFKDFCEDHDEKLTKDFAEVSNWQTSMRGVKVRGVFDTRKEAEFRCGTLHKGDPAHHIFIGTVGAWLPWDPTNLNIESVYANDQLNTLMKNYEQNRIKKDIFFQQNKQESIRAAMMENEQKQFR